MELPRLHLADFIYQGAFRLPAATYGPSSLNYSEGPLEYNPDNHSIFIVGHSHHQNVAEFPVPALMKSPTLGALNMAAAPVQGFAPLLERTTSGNPQGLDRIGGMEYINDKNGPELVVNGYEYYDAPGDNSQTTLVVRHAEALATATVDGYYTFQGGAGHTSGWISPIPVSWQSILGGTHITGQTSGIPIISRTSVGPSAFSFDINQLVATDSVPNPVPTRKLLDFSLTHPLHDDLSNNSGTNALWTHLSRIIYGFIVPGTRTYVTLGHSGGHNSKVCYKCTQDDGNLCGGYCATQADDYYHYYWLWDVNDLVAAMNGNVNAFAVRPYAYGVFPTPFSTTTLGGGTFDPITGTLYLTVQRADREQGTYSNPPVIVAYTFEAKSSPSPFTTVAPSNFLLLQ